MIVCWKHNWPECPLEVLELRHHDVASAKSLNHKAKAKSHHGGTETRRNSLDIGKNKNLTADRTLIGADQER